MTAIPSAILFTEMLFFLSEVYGPVLNERHRVFVETFKTLSKDAQCLLIRMINRRGLNRSGFVGGSNS